MSKPATPESLHEMMVTEAEKALILAIRDLPNGSYIEGMGVVSRTVHDKPVGQPGVIKGVTARCDLQSTESRSAIIERGLRGMLPPEENPR